MMKAESSFVGKRKDVTGNGEKMIRKKCCRRPARNGAPEIGTVVQKLYDTCTTVFKGPETVPPPRGVRRLQRILDKMKPEDVGLSKDLLFFKSQNVSNVTPTITYTTIYQNENFSMCMFFLPPKAVIPLHNHPGMTVFSKLLLGSMHIKAFDWVDPSKSDNALASSNKRLAKLEKDMAFTAPCNTSMLYPSTGGNIHAFTAITPCAVLDVLGPPYSKEDDRDCTYYRDFPYSSFSDGSAGIKEEYSHAWLEAIEMPKELKMDGIEYRGPQIVEHL